MKKLLLALSLGLFLVSCSGDAAIDAQLKAEAAAINTQTPIQVDGLTILNNVEAIAGKKLQYNYTVKVKKEDLDLKVWEKELNNSVISALKSNPALDKMKKAKVSFIYNYKDEKGQELLKLEIKPEQYQ